MQKPQSGEYNPYFQNYIKLVTEGDFQQLLQQNTEALTQFFNSIPIEKREFRYAADKWTIKQLMIHIIDAERVMSYRALTAARGDDKSLLPSMDDQLFVQNANISQKTLSNLITEFGTVRAATEKFFENISEEQSLFRANVVNVPTTVRALGYIIIGHTLHHMNILKERYL